MLIAEIIEAAIYTDRDGRLRRVVTIDARGSVRWCALAQDGQPTSSGIGSLASFARWAFKRVEHEREA